jgi:preprotein translocase subunit SecG
MTALVTAIHVIVCLFLVGVVLLQHGKSADIAATFGGQGSQTAFGPRGAATLLSKATTWSAIIFMVTSIALAILVKKGGGATGSAMENIPAATQPTPTPQPQQQQPAESHPPTQQQQQPPKK